MRLATLTLLAAFAFVATAAIGCSDDEEETPPPEEPVATPPEPEEQAAAGEEVPGFEGFYVPVGGAGGPPPHGGNDMVVYQYPMPVDPLNAGLRSLLDAHGWTIDSDETSPRGSIRLTVSKGDTTYDVRIAGEGGTASIILSK